MQNDQQNTVGDKIFQRVLETIPGLLTWGLILSPIWLGLLYPTLAIYILTFFSVYWAYLAIKHFAGLWIGYKRHKKELTVNWGGRMRKARNSLGKFTRQGNVAHKPQVCGPLSTHPNLQRTRGCY